MSMQAGQKSVVSAGDKKPGRKVLFLIAGIIAIILVAGLAVYYGKEALATRQCSGKNGGQIYKDSVAAIQSGSAVELRKVTRQIKKQKNYESDPSCMYPFVVQQVKNNQFDEARNTAAKIEQSFKNGKKFVSDYTVIGIYNVNSVINKIDAAEYTNKTPSGAGLKLF